MKTHKRCSKCGELKNLEDFYRRNDSKDGRRSYCKSCKNKPRVYKPSRDLRGKTFNKLHVLDDKPIYDESLKRYVWRCECVCGNKKYISGGKLTSGQIKSCGCLGRHGHASDDNTSTEYHSWSAMLSRCNNPNNKFYSYYGGRGIKVCERWSSFSKFLKDMGEKPDNTYSIDRVNNNKGYYPENCVWASKTTQMRNQRIRKNNKSGYKGVFLEQNGTWEASITVDYKKIHLGRFKEKTDAIESRKKAEKQYFKHTF